MRPNRDQWALDMAKLTATRSTCCRRHVGCVLLNSRGHVLATGYNGVAAGQAHCNEQKLVAVNRSNPRVFYWPVGDAYKLTDGELLPIDQVAAARNPEVVGYEVTYPHVCEGATASSGTNLDGCQAIHAEQNALLQCKNIYEIDTCYVTTSPCMTCVKLLLNTSCQRIIFVEEYPHTEARKLWEGSGRTWSRMN